MSRHSTAARRTAHARHAMRWLDHAVEMGLGLYDAITRHDASWRPWLEHPVMVPVLGRV